MHRIVHSSLVALLSILAVSSYATDKYWKGGSGDWDTTTVNWSLTSGGTVDQMWVDGDSGIIEGSAGTITLSGPISISHLRIATNNIEITGGGLNFLPGGTITNVGYANAVDVRCGISGSPDVHVNMVSSWGTVFGVNGLELAPISSNMVLGSIYRPVDNYLELGGTVSNNTFAGFVQSTRNKTYVTGSATWTVQNDSNLREFQLKDGGTLIAEGVLTESNGANLLGGTLHYNVPGVIGSGGFVFSGAALDNTSGSAISTDPNNKNYSINADLTFIGAQGANSDLYMGGSATINADRTITVSNSAAALTIGGAIGDSGFGYKLTKEGAGTLALAGPNTYKGDTFINAGTLRITQTSLSDVAAVRIAAGATLHLDHTGTDNVLAVYTNGVEGPAGTWGSITNASVSNQTALITGMGVLKVLTPTPLEGIRYWDGGDTNILEVGNAISEGNGGTWSTSIANWDAGAGVAHSSWNNNTNDIAFFRGGGGTVNLSEDITLGHLRFDSRHYIIAGKTLHFTPDGTISNTGTAVANAEGNKIAAGITGSPSVMIARGSNEKFRLAPTNTSMTLGTINFGGDQYLYLEGTTTNTAAEILNGNNNQKVYKYGAGTWIVEGELYGGQTWVYEGTLICNGRLWENFQGVKLYGGTLIVNGSVERTMTYTYLNATYPGDGTLGGTGVCYCPISVPTNGVIAPGYPTGTLTITNNPCTIEGTLAITVDGEEHSMLKVYGDLSISNTATLYVTNGVSAPATDVIIVDYGANTLTGQFGVTNMPASWELDYNYLGGTAIALIPPASGTVLIIR